jgi:hypothetical protein
MKSTETYVFAIGQLVLVVVQNERLTEWERRFKTADGRNKLFQSGWAVTPSILHLTVLFNQRLEMFERVSACIFQAIQNEAMHKHFFHPIIRQRNKVCN